MSFIKTSAGWISKVNPESVTLGKRISNMVATNHLGWEVQKFVQKLGWIRASELCKTQGLAELLMESMQKESGVEYRVYESIDSPVRKNNKMFSF